MALKVNGGRLLTNSCRSWGGNSVAGIYGLGVTALREAGTRGSGVMKNWTAGEHEITDQTVKSALPDGYNHPYGWLLPRLAGGMSSRNQTDATFTASGSGAEGINIDGGSTSVFTFDSTGQLIASAIGSSLMEFVLDGNLSATIGAPGSCSFTFTVDASPTAIGWVYGGGTGTFTLGVTSYAIGNMIGAMLPYTELSPQSLANAVWETVLEGTYTAAQVQRIMAAALAGKVSGSGALSPVFRSIDDAEDRITATVDGSGDRTSVTLNG